MKSATRIQSRGRRARWVWSAIVGALLIARGAWAGPLEEASATAVEKAIGGLEQAMKADPARFEGIERIAVIPFRNDPDKRIGDLVQIRLTRTPFKVMLRDDVDRIFAEQKFALDYGDLFANNKDTAARLGNLLGVQAYVFGDVVSAREALDGSAEARLNLKLVNVNTAEVIWGEAVAGTVAPPPVPMDLSKWIKPALIALAALIVIVTGAVVFSGGRKSVQARAAANQTLDRRRQTDRTQRTRVMNDLLGAIEALREAEHRAASDKIAQKDMADRLRRLRDALDGLRREVDLAEPDAVRPAGDGSELTQWQELIDGLTRDIAGNARTIHDALMNAQTDGVGDKINQLTAAIQRLKSKWSDRQGILKNN